MYFGSKVILLLAQLKKFKSIFLTSGNSVISLLSQIISSISSILLGSLVSLFPLHSKRVIPGTRISMLVTPKLFATIVLSLIIYWLPASITKFFCDDSIK